MNELNETCLYLGQVRRASPLLHLTCICCHLGARENSKDRAGDEVGYKWDGGWDGSVARGDDWWTERRREQWHREASPQHESYGLQHVSVHQGWLLIDNYSELRYLLEHYDQSFEKANLASGTTSRHENLKILTTLVRCTNQQHSFAFMLQSLTGTTFHTTLLYYSLYHFIH